MPIRSSCLKTVCLVTDFAALFQPLPRSRCLADMRREKKEADRKRKTELMEAFGKYLSSTSWLGPETHWRNAEDKIRQEFPEYTVLVEIGADCRTVFEKACDDKRREV
jgi:hypothetical protein